MPKKRRLPDGPREVQMETTPAYLIPAENKRARGPSRPRVRPPTDLIVSRVDFKLREARFFLSQLEFVSGQPSGKTDPEAFAFYFSAFISAASSVTYVLRDQSWFKAWVDALPDERDRELVHDGTEIRPARRSCRTST